MERGDSTVEINIEDNFELLLDKNSNIAYKALQELQKGSLTIKSQD